MTKIIQGFLTEFIIFLFSIHPIFLLIFGVMMALISGSIEYLVLTQIFPDSPIVLPFVIAVEGTKAIFIFNRGKAQNNAVIQKNENLVVTTLRLSFILLSIYCSTIFCLYKMNNPNANSYYDEKVAIQTESLNSDINRIGETFTDLKQTLTDNFQIRLKRLNDLKETEKKNKNKKTGFFEGKRYEAIQKDIDSLEQGYNQDLLALMQNKESQIAELRKDFEGKKIEIKKQSKNNKISGTKILQSSLSIYNLGKEPSDLQYLINIIFISLLMVLSMEGMIYTIFFSLAENYGEILDMNESQYKNRQQAENIQEDIEHIYKSDQTNRTEFFNHKMDQLNKKLRDFHENTLNKIKSFFNSKS